LSFQLNGQSLHKDKNFPFICTDCLKVLHFANGRTVYDNLIKFSIDLVYFRKTFSDPLVRVRIALLIEVISGDKLIGQIELPIYKNQNELIRGMFNCNLMNQVPRSNGGQMLQMLPSSLLFKVNNDETM